MGLMTLDNFETDLQTTLGDRSYSDSELDRWINAGYYDLAGAVQFEILVNDEDINTVDGTQTITAPTNTMAIQYVRNTTGDYLLAWLPKNELLRRPTSAATEGTPRYWTLNGTSIYLSPVPDAVYSIKVGTIEPPAVLTGSATTVFPEIWDQAVFQLAAYHAFMSLGDEQRATVWLARAITYIQSRVTEQDYQGSLDGQGVSLPNGLIALQARLAGLQGGGQ